MLFVLLFEEGKPIIRVVHVGLLNLLLLMNEIALQPEALSPVFDETAPASLLHIQDETVVERWPFIQTFLNLVQHVKRKSLSRIAFHVSFLVLVGLKPVQEGIVKGKTKFRIF